MAIPKCLIRPLCWSVALVLVGVAGWYSPILGAAGWHLFHPRGRVNYHGLHVMVPWPWTADMQFDPETDAPGSAAPQGILLKNAPFTMAWHEPAQTIFLTVISSDSGVSAEQQTAGWMGSFRATHPGSEFDEKPSAAIPAGSTCLSARNPGDAQDVVWTCISVKGGWVADFEGRTSEEPVFFRVVENLKR
jgi:hypothetical protein